MGGQQPIKGATRQGYRVDYPNFLSFVSGSRRRASSKKEVSEVIESLGFAVIDLGTLAGGSKLQQPHGAVATLNFIKLS
jgi:predicted dinucleotide-binding enzyme